MWLRSSKLGLICYKSIFFQITNWVKLKNKHHREIIHNSNEWLHFRVLSMESIVRKLCITQGFTPGLKGLSFFFSLNDRELSINFVASFTVALGYRLLHKTMNNGIDKEILPKASVWASLMVTKCTYVLGQEKQSTVTNMKFIAWESMFIFGKFRKVRVFFNSLIVCSSRENISRAFPAGQN